MLGQEKSSASSVASAAAIKKGAPNPLPQAQLWKMRNDLCFQNAVWILSEIG